MKTFKQVIQAIQDGTHKPPQVFCDGKQIDAIWYQLCVDRYFLSIMLIGLKVPNRKLADIKSFYEIKGRSIQQVLDQLNIIIHNYKSTQ